MDGRMKSQSSKMMMIFCGAQSLDQAAGRVSVHPALYTVVFLWVVVAVVMQTAVADDDEGMDLLLIYYY